MESNHYMSRLSNPPVFQGNLKKRSYFEGWYIKSLCDDLQRSIAFIPGISLGPDRHAFIQINTSGHDTQYITFPLEDFSYKNDRFDIKIGNNHFSSTGVSLDLEKAGISLQGELNFSDLHLFPSFPMSPGIMGPFTYVPFMECYHGVVSMRHKVQGELKINGEHYLFENGIGYIEKDWGRSFPSSWVWMQANPFRNSNASFMMSVARVPWMGMNFTGVIGFINHEDKLYRFGTYLGDRVKHIDRHDGGVDIIIGKRNHTLHLQAELDGVGGGLIAPVNGEMNRQMKESLNSTLHVELRDQHNKILFKDSSHIAGLEISGDIEKSI